MGIEMTLLSGVALRDQEISGARTSGLLALLAMDLRNGSSAARLIAGVWPQDAPENPTKALQVLVSRTRSQLGADLIASTPTGYRLTLSPEQIDATALEVHSAAAQRHARAADHAAALDRAAAGLALWNGVIEHTSGADPLSELRIATQPAYRTLLIVFALALSRLGRYAEAVGPLTDAAASEPRNEEVLAELLRAEADTAGPAAALARYDAYRRMLREELGADPGTALQTIHKQLLRANEPVVRHGILHDPNPLLGRETDIAAVTALLRSARVVSLIGPGGLGKTRMAHAVGRLAEQRVVHLVPLAGVQDDGMVTTEVASALGAGDASQAGPLTGNSVISAIAKSLGSGPTLLILDNCEQVLEGVSALVGPLVSLVADLRVLVTSRAPLGLTSEAVHLLPELAPATAAELFGQRARAVRPDIALPTAEVAALCAQLDGLPLAIELAAARVRVMSVAEISGRLVDRFALLRSGSRDAPQRHRTLYAVVEWSWNLLDEHAQAAMRLLSIFPNGFTATAADRLLNGDSGETGGLEETLEMLEHLVDHSLIQITEVSSGTRFRMLETVKDFSAARRADAGEGERALAGFVAWAREFGLGANETAFTDQGEKNPVRAEQDNLVRALRLGLDRSDGPTVAATWAALGAWWYVGAHYARIVELVGECAWVLSHYRPEPGYVEVTRTAATVCALSAVTQSGFELRSMLVLRRLPAAPPDTLVRAVAVIFRAGPELLGPDSAALDRLCASDQPLLAGVAHLVASFRAEQTGDRDEALAATRRMLAAFERTSNTWIQFQARCRIGKLALLSEHGELARQQVERALRQLVDHGPRPDRVDLIVGLVMASLQLGDIESAEQWLAQVADHADPFAQPYKVIADAEIRLARGDIDNGLRRWRAIAELVVSTSHPFYRPDPRGVQVWALEARSAMVLAHAYHGRLDLIADLVEDLPWQVIALLEHPATQPGGYLAELTACGAVLLALAVVDINRGLVADGARLIALAERFDPPRQIHPTMSSKRARECAEDADEAAYAEGVSTYAALDVPGLRSAAFAALRKRVA
ncbi:BTAD domain-containing putative transcriptional regulator [Nocardia sp. NPDC051463]|uniref:AfsR/SARP family transcriptional regulator n=1 Tax=Nocardia sp. NPDC051463 TaxID=3154845 RepID=UPI003424C765